MPYTHSKVALYYETFGDKKNAPIILIMGIGGQYLNWPIEFIQGLVAHHYFVIALDNRDAGLSSNYNNLQTPDLFAAIQAKDQGKPFTPPYTLEDMASDIINLMDELQIKKAHLVGISMGGMIAQVFAIEHPTRLLSLTCIATTTGDPTLPPAKAEVQQFFFKPRKEAKNVESYVENMLEIYRIYNHPDYYHEENARRTFARAYERAYNPNGFKRQLFAVLFAEPRCEKLKKINIPSLIIHGNYDPVFPLAHGEQLAACLPNSHLEVFDKMGHGLPENLVPKIVDKMAAFYAK